MVPTMDCVPSINPRFVGLCIRCGKRVFEPKPIRRNLVLERQITEEACRGAVDPESFIEHAEARAQTLSGEYVDDPMLIKEGRNRVLDAREEAVDARNHLVFWFQEHPEAYERELVLEALKHFALAYEILRDV